MFWIDKFVNEKELGTDRVFEVEGASGPNFIPLAVVVEHIKIATKQEQLAIKKMLIKIDFVNRDVMPYFEHLAKAIAI